jgi:sulfur carrier protein
MSESAQGLVAAGFIRVNGVEEKLAADTIAELLVERELAPDMRGIAVARNGRVVPRAVWAATSLCAGDTVEIVLAKQGG